jgi:hypothetical protein
MRRSETRSSPPYAPLLQMAYGALSTQILCVAGLLSRNASCDGLCSSSPSSPHTSSVLGNGGPHLWLHSQRPYLQRPSAITWITPGICDFAWAW